MLAGESDQLVALGALGDLDAVLVGPLLDLAVGPGVEECVREALLGVGGRLGGGGVGGLQVQAGETRIAADGGNELVTGRGLGCGIAALVQPCLEVGVGPRLVEPIAGVGCGLGDLVGGGLVVLADALEKSVTLAGLGNGDAVLIRKGLEVGLGPSGMVSKCIIMDPDRTYVSKIQSRTLP